MLLRSCKATATHLKLQVPAELGLRCCQRSDHAQAMCQRGQLHTDAHQLGQSHMPSVLAMMSSSRTCSGTLRLPAGLQRFWHEADGSRPVRAQLQ